MIFVTVGTERFPFNRLIKALDEFQADLQGEQVFMQIGYATYVPSCAHSRLLSYDDFRQKIIDARIIVSHAGVGTLLMCASQGKKPIMMARRKCYGEHVDDHQQMLANRLASRGGILLADNPEDLWQYIFRSAEPGLLDSAPNSTEISLGVHLKNLLDKIACRN